MVWCKYRFVINQCKFNKYMENRKASSDFRDFPPFAYFWIKSFDLLLIIHISKIKKKLILKTAVFLMFFLSCFSIFHKFAKIHTLQQGHFGLPTRQMTRRPEAAIWIWNSQYWKISLMPDYINYIIFRILILHFISFDKNRLHKLQFSNAKSVFIFLP